MGFETGLNLVWACVAVCAFGVFVRRELRSRRGARRGRAGRLLVLVFAILFLFPCVSESDDLLSLQHLRLMQQTQAEWSERSNGSHLARFFETLQQFPLAARYALLLALLFVAWMTPAVVRVRDRRLPVECGRAPPMAFA